MLCHSTGSSVNFFFNGLIVEKSYTAFFFILYHEVCLPLQMSSLKNRSPTAAVVINMEKGFLMRFYSTQNLSKLSRTYGREWRVGLNRHPHPTRGVFSPALSHLLITALPLHSPNSLGGFCQALLLVLGLTWQHHRFPSSLRSLPLPSAPLLFSLRFSLRAFGHFLPHNLGKACSFLALSG